MKLIRKLRFSLFATALFAADALFAQQQDAPDASPAPTPVPSVSPTSNSMVENAVVKIYATERYPDFMKPWTKLGPQELSGSGVVIEGKRILTNAHVIRYASQVQVQGNQDGDKIFATVEAVAPGIDLAVLKLDDETFFATHPPLQRSNEMPQIKDAVMVYGYPKGGNSLSITKGIVSRMEFVFYNYSTYGLRIQIDAAINPGNSGGPAVVGDKMIGLAFSHLNNAQNIGYIIPCEEIDLFLHSIADGHYAGKPALFDDFQTLENPALRAFLKIDPSVKGVVVHEPFDTDASYPLKEWDVVTKIGDIPIDDEGMVRLSNGLRVHFEYYIQKTARNGKVSLTIVRDGKEKAVEVPVLTRRPKLIPDLEGDYPSYFVYGPLVFSTATSEYIYAITYGSSGEKATSMLSFIGSPLLKRRSDKPSFPGENLVVVSSPFLPHKLSKGYGSPFTSVVKTVNGTPIKNLNHLVEVLRDAKEDFIIIEFDQKGGETLVFPRKEMVATTDEILRDNSILGQGSPDLLAIWNAKSKKTDQ